MGSGDYNITPPAGRLRLSRAELIQWLARLFGDARPAAIKRRQLWEMHYARWQAVATANTRGRTWEEAYNDATDALSGTSYAGEPDTMRASYKVVQKRRRQVG
jgi:hypothetical protein